MPSDYATLRSLPEDSWPSAVEDLRPRSDSVQWWLAMIGIAETEARFKLRQGVSAEDTLKFVASFIAMGVRGENIDSYQEAYWCLRFAKTAVDFRMASHQVPEQFTPDGSARRALAAITLTADRAIVLSKQRFARSDIGLDDEPSDDDLVLSQTELVLSSLGLIDGSIRDERVAGEVSHWRQIYQEMGP